MDATINVIVCHSLLEGNYSQALSIFCNIMIENKTLVNNTADKLLYKLNEYKSSYISLIQAIVVPPDSSPTIHHKCRKVQESMKNVIDIVYHGISRMIEDRRNNKIQDVEQRLGELKNQVTEILLRK